MTATEPFVVDTTTAERVQPPTPDSSDSPGSTLPPATPKDRIWLAVLLVATAVLYLWNITVNGNANTFYAGAAWAGSRNWEALLFGSVDPSNFITVDKPPVSQWVMGLSGQIFGYSSASMLIPEALMGVAAVALMYAMVARIGGRGAGLLAGLALAITPVAAMMFRFNNPDAAMVLLMTAAAYCTLRATARGSMRWLALAGVALGFAFLTKMLEGLMVLPALGAVYLIAAPLPFWRRIGHLVVAAVALVLSAGWYVLLTLVWPASSRPYLAGSTDNNFMNLVLGYNGLDRVEGGSGGGAGHGGGANMMADFMRENPDVARRFAGGGGMFGSSPGINRLFSGEFGAEISFLLPTALIALVVVVALRGRRPRTDLVRAGAILFGLWLIVDGLVLSYMSGIAHPYYSLAIAPPIAGLVGLGLTEAWSARAASVRWQQYTARFGLAGMIAAAGIWSFVLLDRESSWQPWIRWCVLVVAVVSALMLALPSRMGRRLALAAGVLGVIATFAAPAAYAIAGDSAAHTGGSPSVLPGRGATGGHQSTGARFTTDSASLASAASRAGFGGMGGFGGGSTTLPANLDTLLQNSHARWAAAVSRTGTASSVELAARVPVMGVGGFSNDPAPSLQQFQKYVAEKDIGYYLMSSAGTGAQSEQAQGLASSLQKTFGGGRSSVTTQIQQWVQSNFHGTTMGNYTVYNLTVAPSPQPSTTTTAAGSTGPNTTADVTHSMLASTHRGHRHETGR